MLKAAFNAQKDEYVELKREYDMKVPFVHELEQKYQRSTKQVAKLNTTLTKILFVIFIF